MRMGRKAGVVWTMIAIGCASAGSGATPGVLVPLGAHLTAEAPTGAPIPLHVDPNARVVRSTAPDLPAATYLPAQADRGEKVFNQVCAMCHARTQFIGQTFIDNWNDHRVADFFTLIQGTMPLNSPGGLKDDQYLAVVAYLLKENHAGMGKDSLGTDSLSLRRRRIAVKAP
ncbi:MAG TPA: c-type cytochrome [Gemmatimonadaceae bacterium]|jgi:mono/diheme cytochrome c family protein